MTISVTSSKYRDAAWAWARSPGTIFLLLIIALFAVAVTAGTVGSAGISPARLAAAVGLTHGDPTSITRDQLVLWSIRLPRVILAIFVGALLAGSGTIMQGLFRNPLADPGLVGVLSGGAFAAAMTIVIGDKFFADGESLPFEFLPFAAFVGALAATWVLYRIATRENRTSIAIFLLAGLAIAALANAGTSLLVFLADDRQLRDITFWLLGSLAGATWAKVTATFPFFVVMLMALPWISRGLDFVLLGEAEAFYMGIRVERLKRISILLVAAASGAAVSISGIIGFVGIVAPHLLRLVVGPGHAVLLPASMCLGAILLLSADTLARVIAAPAELPIGILTAVIGAPFFIMLLLRQRGFASL